MPRFVLLRGVPGKLVANPQVEGSFLCQQALAEVPANAPRGLVGRFSPVERVVQMDGEGHILKALRNGELVQLAGPVVASTAAEAEKLLHATAKPGKSRKDEV